MALVEVVLAAESAAEYDEIVGWANRHTGPTEVLSGFLEDQPALRVVVTPTSQGTPDWSS